MFNVKNKIYNISKEDLINSHYLDEGDESFVYKFGNDVFKIYKTSCFKQRLSENDVDFLSKINTKRILLPEDKIYENGRFNGYVMPYIKPGSKDSIKKLKMNSLMYELKALKEDLLNLKENNVMINDIHIDNYIFNGSMYFIDPGSYTINDKLSSRYIEIINREMMYDFIIDRVFLKSTNTPKIKREKLTKHLPIDEYMCDTLDYDIDPNETLMHYVKRIVK